MRLPSAVLISGEKNGRLVKQTASLTIHGGWLHCVGFMVVD
jgi:hypothetical protein